MILVAASLCRAVGQLPVATQAVPPPRRQQHPVNDNSALQTALLLNPARKCHSLTQQTAVTHSENLND